MNDISRQSLIRKFDSQAERYDNKRYNDKMHKYRKRIFTEAQGKVLEVAVGAGYNFPFYRGEIELLGLDFSSEMLKAAQKEAESYPFKAAFEQQDVESAIFDENSFDTIVSSLSFCAYQDPARVLNSFRKWCRPGGRILMMEHGISTNSLLAGMQKSLDPLAVKIAGCHQNRNISDLVKESDLKVTKEERYLSGCLYLIWAAP